MSAPLAERFRVIDADSHVSEPGDLWTSRVSSRWGDLVPHVIRSPRGARPDGATDEVWVFGGVPALPAAMTAIAGSAYYLPDHPATLADAHPAAYDASARLAYLDEVGLHAQVIYPNVGGFGSGGFLRLKEPELMLECVRAYNDFLAEWCGADPERLIPIMALPFWDVEACVREMGRAAELGHRGIVFGSEPHTFDQPMLADPHWDPLWASAQELELPMNFHILSGSGFDLFGGFAGNGQRTNAVSQSVAAFLNNSRAISEVIVSGICHRFPGLRFVSVESGVGWIPFLLEGLDYQWLNMGAHKEHPERDLLPSEYFRRQIYGCFWFERESARRVLDLYPDNFLFETDFPHPTSLAEGPVSTTGKPKDWLERNLVGWPEDLLRKVLHQNAARLYRLDKDRAQRGHPE
ncbi:MAG: amidohydrolase family protein [Myxococcota bacterium]